MPRPTARVTRSSTVAGSSPRATRNDSRVPGGASAGSRTIRAVVGAADDGVAALERRLRPEDTRAPSRRRRAPPGHRPTRRIARSVERRPPASSRTRSRASRAGRIGAETDAEPLVRGPAARPRAGRVARVARSSSSPTRSRALASCASGLSRSSARRSATTSRPAAVSASRSPPRRARRPAPRTADEELRPIRDDDLGGGGRRRRPDVGGEVGQRDVRLVADAADDRDPMGDDGPDDRLVVERPEVLERPAAAGQDRDRGRFVRPSRGDPVVGVALDLAEGAPTRLAGADSPWTCAATRTTRVSGQRRPRTWQMSFQTAPVGLVMTAIVAGRGGSGRLRAASNSPSAASRALSASKRRVRSPRPAGWIDST